MTGNEVISRAWVLLGDTSPRKRNPAKEMVTYLNDGVRDLLARRPVLKLDESGARSTFTDLTTETYSTDALPMDETYREGLAHYVAGRVFELDEADEHNAQMSVMHFKKYMETT